VTARRVVRERIDPRLTEATVPEFERRVNELMLVPLALAERRTRSSRKGVAAASAVRKRQTGLWR